VGSPLRNPNPVKAATKAEIQRVADAVVRHTTALANTLRRNGIR